MKLYFVYILEYKTTGQFYIGVTDDAERRKRSHIHCINKAFHKIRNNEIINNIQKVHYEIARKVKITKNPFDMRHTFNFIHSRCIFTVLQILNYLDEAVLVENDYIAESISDPKNLNDAITSTYKNKKC